MTRNSRKDLKTEQEESIPLHITLEALREIEAALGVDSLAELARVPVRPKAAHLVTVLEILARAASAPDSDRRVRTAAISIDAALAPISTAIDDMGRA